MVPESTTMVQNALRSRGFRFFDGVSAQGLVRSGGVLHSAGAEAGVLPCRRGTFPAKHPAGMTAGA